MKALQKVGKSISESKVGKFVSEKSAKVKEKVKEKFYGLEMNYIPPQKSNQSKKNN